MFEKLENSMTAWTLNLQPFLKCLQKFVRQSGIFLLAIFDAYIHHLQDFPEPYEVSMQLL